MTDKIQGLLSLGFITRMQMWAMGSDVATSSSSWPIEGPLVGIGSGSKFHTTHIPPMLGSVHDTEMAICAVPNRYQQAVRQYWKYEGQSLRWHGRHRGVNRETFEAWVIKGHELLKAEFAARAGRWRRIKEAAQAPIPA